MPKTKFHQMVFGSLGIEEHSMRKFQSQQLVDLSGVVTISVYVPFYDSFESACLEIRPGKTARIEQHVPDVAGERVPVPDAEMVELVPPEEQSFETEGREEMIDPGHPLGHPGVVGILGLEEELEHAAVSSRREMSAASVPTAAGPR